MVSPMPTITIYLTNALFDKVRDAPSKIVRAALEYYFREKDESSRDVAPSPDGEPRQMEQTSDKE